MVCSAGCNPVPFGDCRFDSYPAQWPVAQWIECWTSNPDVVGSNPTRPVMEKIMKLFLSLDPILTGQGWSISITPRIWKIENVIDSIGHYIRIGPIVLEYRNT